VPWETDRPVTASVATLEITASGQDPCAQASHAWVVEGGWAGIPWGYPIHLTGVVSAGAPITFQFLDRYGNEVARHTTAPAGGNCVVAHEPETVNTASVPSGSIQVLATYLQWESGLYATVPVGTLNIGTPPPPPAPDQPPCGPDGGCVG
jgi:hypothetical protein